MSVAGFSCANAVQDEHASGQAGGGNGNYSFADVTVRRIDENTARISWSTRWQGETFPGVRSCRWMVSGENGEPIGERSDTFVGMDPAAEEVSTEVTVEGDPASAGIECAEARLDTGSPYEYSFSGVRPILLEGQDGAWAIEYDAAWQGSGAAGPVTCTAALVADNGADLSSQEVNIYSSEGDVENGIVMTADPGDAHPESAILSNCQPFA